uniref:Uncharacterized protein n=1 Tax=Eutreptiella gymnastica TaxID=73025 RepID=A0A7S4FUE5_9EUGL
MGLMEEYPALHTYCVGNGCAEDTAAGLVGGTEATGEGAGYLRRAHLPFGGGHCEKRLAITHEFTLSTAPTPLLPHCPLLPCPLRRTHCRDVRSCVLFYPWQTSPPGVQTCTRCSADVGGVPCFWLRSCARRLSVKLPLSFHFSRALVPGTSYRTPQRRSDVTLRSVAVGRGGVTTGTKPITVCIYSKSSRGPAGGLGATV